MKEFKAIKNLLLDVLSNQGGTYQNQAINAINAIKFDQEIVAPIIINQSISVLNVTIQQRIVQAIKMIDHAIIKPKIENKVKTISSICECEFPCPVVEVPIDFYAVVQKYQHQLIDLAYEKVGKHNTVDAAYILGLKRTTLAQMNKRRKKGLPVKSIVSKHPSRVTK